MIIQCLPRKLTEEEEDNKIIKSAFLSALIILMGLIASCVSTGTPQLSANSIMHVIEEQSSKDEVLLILGPPEQALKLDQSSLSSYIHRVFPSKVSEDDFIEGQYEVWTYNKWSHFAVDPLMAPSYENSKVCLLVFNGSGICIKKFYDEAENMSGPEPWQ